MNKIGIAILNWNGEQLLRRFLPEVIAHSAPQADIYVIDNRSTDGSREYLGELPEVKCIELDENYGFAEGYNRGLEAVPNPWVVLMNSDIETTGGWLDDVLATIEKHPDSAAFQPVIGDCKRREYFEHAGAAGGYIDKYGYLFCRGRIFDTLEKDDGRYSGMSGEKLFWATGACLIIKREAYFRAGGLDPRFFAHMEEVDLCWRLQRMGYTLRLCAASKVYHLGGGTLSSMSPQKTYLNFRNNLFLLLKNLPPGKLWSLLFLRLVLDGVAALFFLAKGQYAFFAAVLKAHLHFYTGIRKMYASRKDIPAFAVDTSVIYPKSIVKAYFLKGKKHFGELGFRSGD